MNRKPSTGKNTPLPSPAELATFARAIDWWSVETPHRARVLPSEIFDLLRVWKEWECHIAGAHATEMDKYEMIYEFNKPENLFKIQDVMLRLKIKSRETLKDYYVSGLVKVSRGQISKSKAEEAWDKICKANVMDFLDMNGIYMERKRRRTERAMNGVNARKRAPQAEIRKDARGQTRPDVNAPLQETMLQFSLWEMLSR